MTGLHYAALALLLFWLGLWALVVIDLRRTHRRRMAAREANRPTDGATGAGEG